MNFPIGPQSPKKKSVKHLVRENTSFKLYFTESKEQGMDFERESMNMQIYFVNGEIVNVVAKIY